MFLIYKHDLEKEPIQMLVKAFFGGVLSIFIALAIALPLGLFESAFPSGILRSHFDQYYDGILYAIFISMGFALVENILYVMEGGLGVAVMRAVLSVPGHMLFVIPMGYYLSLSKFEAGKEAANHRILSLVLPMLLHGTFDFILMYMNAKSNVSPFIAGLLVIAFVAFDIYIWRLGLKKIKLHIHKDKTYRHIDSNSNGETID